MRNGEGGGGKIGLVRVITVCTDGGRHYAVARRLSQPKNYCTDLLLACFALQVNNSHILSILYIWQTSSINIIGVT